MGLNIILKIVSKTCKVSPVLWNQQLGWFIYKFHHLCINGCARWHVKQDRNLYGNWVMQYLEAKLRWVWFLFPKPLVRDGTAQLFKLSKDRVLVPCLQRNYRGGNQFSNLGVTREIQYITKQWANGSRNK